MAKKKLTAKKAKEILHDKEVHGKPLTEKQRKFFGAVASGAVPKAQKGLPTLRPFPAENVQAVLDFPQKALTSLITGKYQTPAEAMNITNPFAATAVNTALNPITWMAGGGIRKVTKPTKTPPPAPPKPYSIVKGQYRIDKNQYGGAIEGTMGGLTDKGFNYNPAWGGRWEDGGMIPIAQNGLTTEDSVRHQANKILQYEQLRGGPGGTPLPSYSDPKYMNMLMKGVYPEVKKILPNASAMESAEAMDFIFNAGWNKENNKISKDPRAFALQEYYRQYDPSKLDADGKWPGRKNPAYSFDQEYNATIGKLPENDRRALMNRGRDWYYRNINNPSPGVPNSNYYDTWYGRISNTDDFGPFNPNNPKFTPKKAMGGSLPGMTGFMYARTGAPSNGPYAKKTKPSAQNGMTFYQHGLDWKPRNISQDGREVRALKPLYEPRPASDISQTVPNLRIKGEQAKKQVAQLEKKTQARRKELKQALPTASEETVEMMINNPQPSPSFTPSVSPTKEQTLGEVGMQTLYALANPVTSLKYLSNQGRLPRNMQFGEMNVLDIPTSIVNPYSIAAELAEIPGEIRRGEYLEATLGGLNLLPIAKAAAPTVKTASKQVISKIKKTKAYNKLDASLTNAYNNYVFPITNRKTIKELKQFNKDYQHFMKTSPEAKERLRTIGIDQSQLPDVDFTIIPGERTTFLPAYPNSAADVINMDVKQLRRLNKYFLDLDFKSAYEHEYGHFLQKEAYRQSIAYRVDLAKYLAQLNAWKSAGNKPVRIKFPKNMPDGIKANIQDQIDNQKTGKPIPPLAEARPTLFDRKGLELYDENSTGTMTVLERTPMTRKNAEYFANAEKIEAFPHLRELRGMMQRAGYIKNIYDPLSPEMISNFIEKNPFNRVSTFTDYSDPNLMQRISDLLNRMPAALPPAIAVGAAAASPQNTPKQQYGGVIEDDMGQWAYPGEITKINSNEITMEGVPYPVLGISDTGDTQMMYPEEDYIFDGESVTEYPMMQMGGSVQDKGQLIKLDQLTNFTNYNKMAKKGKKLPKAQIGQYIGGDTMATQPVAWKDYYDQFDYMITGKTDFERMLEQDTDDEDGGDGTTGGQLETLGQFTNTLAGLFKKGGKLKKAQAGVPGGFMQAPGLPNIGSPASNPNILRGFPLPISPASNSNITKGFSLKRQQQSVLSQQPKSQGFGKTALSSIDQVLGPATAIVGAIQEVDAAIRRKREAKMTRELAKLTSKAAGTRPEITERKYVRPEDMLVDPGQVFPTYGTGTNYLQLQNGGDVTGQIGGNPGEVMNLYNPGTLYENLGFEPLEESEKLKRYRRGGKAQVGDMMGTLTSGVQAVGNIVSGILDVGTRKFTKQAQRELSNAAFMQSAAGLQSQYAPFMEQGGYLSHNLQPQVIAKFGEYSMKDLLRPDNQSDIMRAGGNIKRLKKNYMGEDENIGMYQMGGQLDTHWGGDVELMSYNPYMPGSGETYMVKGNSHSESDGRGNTGVGISYGNNMVEAERNEPIVEMEEGGNVGGTAAVIYGDMKIPNYGLTELVDSKAKGKKFKHYVAELSKDEAKQNKKIKKGMELLDTVKTYTPFDKLTMNSAIKMIEGADMKLMDLAAKKRTAAGVQNAILETSEELGLDSAELAKGKIKSAKPEEMAKMGKQIKKAQRGRFTKWDYEDPLSQMDIYEDPVTNPELFSISPINAYVTKDGLIDSPTGVVTKEQTDALQAAGLFPLGGTSFSGTGGKGKKKGIKPKADVSGTVSKILGTALPYLRPTNQLPLDPNQIAPEMTALSSNVLEGVPAQTYQPMLGQVSKVSVAQAKINEINAEFNAIARVMGNNPAALSILAANKYRAISQAVGEEFAINQQRQDAMFAQNIGSLNDATLKNLAILDQQFTRQAQAKSATKAIAQTALSSIADKIGKNKLENRTLGIYENLYNYRFGPKGVAYNLNPLAQFMIPSVAYSDPETRKQMKAIIDKMEGKAKNGSIVKAIKNL